MGLAAITQHIETAIGEQLKHPLCLETGKVHIGVPYLSSLIVMDADTGKLTRSNLADSTHFVKVFEALETLSDAERVALFNQADETPSNLLPVHLCGTRTIEESSAAIVGYPYTTVTGERMYENTAFATRPQAVAQMIERLSSEVSFLTEYGVKDMEAALEKAKANLEKAKDDLASAQSSLATFKGELESLGPLQSFEVFVFDNMERADDLWGSLTYQAHSAEDAETRAYAHLVRLVAKQKTELDLGTLRLEVRTAAPAEAPVGDSETSH